MNANAIPLDAAFLARVEAKVQRGAPDECWPYTGARDVAGYGAVVLSPGSRRRTKAHRVVLQASLGRPIRRGMLACHRCDNPPCCNPAHLYEGTAKDNARDAVERGRNAHPLGSRRPDVRARLIRRYTIDRGEPLLDDVDWTYLGDTDRLAAADDVERFVARAGATQ